MIGHSFGARVVLAAISRAELARRVDSVLLLQPAINRWCFSPEVVPLATKERKGPPGGYRVALDRVETPVFTTYSEQDQALHDAFHLFVQSNVGEVIIAAFGDTDRYGALGGYGPSGLGGELATVRVSTPGDGYKPEPGCRVLAIDGSSHDGATAPINGHGDVVTPFTAWMLHCQTAVTATAPDL
jgi:pimeloyl-ACP methyl ester carboxylesterase